MSRFIQVGGVKIGGGAPVSVQSMCDTDTRDSAATLAQIGRLADAGCQIVRVAVPDKAAIAPLAEITASSPLPVVADIHFDYRLALDAVAAGVSKVRINPGNIGAPERVRAVAQACQAARVPIRIGVNSGSVSKTLLAKHGAPTAAALVESATTQMAMLHEFGFEDICISLKSSSVTRTIEAYRLMRQVSDVPLHLGVTEAGTLYHGIIKSAVCMGALLADGIGDTLRVSLTEDVCEEVRAARAILQALGLRRGVEVVACPTCGRTRIDLRALAYDVERRLDGYDRPMKVAVMGCAVNGPGEAADADFGIAGGDGEGLLFARGQIVKKVAQEQLVDELMALIDAT